MSWQDRDKLDLKITTGDGKTYTVAWLTAQQKVKWHGGEQSYIGLNDSKIKKEKRQGRVFPLEFYFMGDDHLEDAANFRESLDDPNPSTIEHPYYNTIVAQILELNIDNDGLNVSRCSCTALETMVNYSAVISNPKDVVLLKKVELDALLDDEPEIKLNIQEVNTVKYTTTKSKELGMKIISIPAEAQEYINAFSTASSYVNTFTSSPILAMRALNNLLTMPAQVTASVNDRIRIMIDQFNILRSTVNGLVVRPAYKAVYVAQQSAIISAMCKAAVEPLLGEYLNASVSLRISNLIVATYNTFKLDMDALQTINNGSPLSFVPSFNLANKLEEIVSATTSGLYVIALSGRRKRTFTLSEDSNIILLTYMLYRLDSGDARMNELITNNNFTHKDIALGLEKGRIILYYV